MCDVHFVVSMKHETALVVTPIISCYRLLIHWEKCTPFNSCSFLAWNRWTLFTKNLTN